MDPKKKQKLEAAGWKFTTVTDFLGLTPEEAQLVELRVSVARAVRETRLRLGVTRAQVATRVGSEQSRIAKLEAGAENVTLDALFTAYFSLGGKADGIARAVRSSGREAQAKSQWSQMVLFDFDEQPALKEWRHQASTTSEGWKSDLALERKKHLNAEELTSMPGLSLVPAA